MNLFAKRSRLINECIYLEPDNPMYYRLALNYMESWYHGEPGKMKEALHRELAKRHLELRYVRNTTATDMVIYTRGGYGEALWDESYTIDVIVLDYFANIASVKVVAPHYYEYLHLVKVNGKWSILNALYRSKSPKK